MKLTTRIRRGLGMTAAFLALCAGLTACGSGDDGDNASAGGDKSITLGIIPSWTDGMMTAYLWKGVLEEEGYDVEIQDIADAAPLYTGVAKGDVDVFPSAWSEVTHKSYMDKYGEDLEDLGAYYDGATLTLAVPEYSKLTSIEELPDHVDELDGKIIGIEPGAGLTKTTKESVIPTYGLDKAGFTLVESSTTAMLAELQKAIKDEQEIVVTLWRPFWANAEFKVKDLEDPEGALGATEALHAIATKGFADENPEVAEMFGNLELDDATYGELEKAVVDAYDEGKEAAVEEAIGAWLDENPDFIENLKS
jgi:glycine betaine/proline transport system substrate-binding protein